MKRPRFFINALFVVLCLASLASSVQAAITWNGDTKASYPYNNNPNTWTTSTTAYIGNTSNGSVTVASGSNFFTLTTYLGCNAAVRGDVTVTGSGSTWTNNSSLHVGYYGVGTLNITEGGAVSNGQCKIGDWAGSSGSVTVSGASSTWSSSDLSIYRGPLNIGGGATVTVTETTGVYYTADASGAINFDSGGGTLTTKSL